MGQVHTYIFQFDDGFSVSVLLPLSPSAQLSRASLVLDTLSTAVQCLKSHNISSLSIACCIAGTPNMAHQVRARGMSAWYKEVGEDPADLLRFGTADNHVR